MALFKIEVLDTNANAFGDAQSAAIDELGDELIGRGHIGKQVVDFVLRQDGWYTFRSSSADGSKWKVNRSIQDMAVQEEQGIQRLVLG